MKLTVYEALWLQKEFETAIKENRLAQVVMPNGKMFVDCKRSYVAAVARDIRKIVAQAQKMAADPANVKRYRELMEKKEQKQNG